MKIVCNVKRGKYVESRHEVYFVAIDEAEKTILSSGNPEYITCIRSALKPFQASAAIAEGATENVGFISEEIALMCASHNGEKIHVEARKSISFKMSKELREKINKNRITN